MDHTPLQKAVILAVVSLVTLAAPFTGNAFMPALPEMLVQLQSDQQTVNLIVSVFLLALGVCPLWHAHLSQRYGRRPVYIVTTLIFVVTSVGLAVATNVNAVIGLRFLQAVGSSTAQSVGAGTLSDIYLPQEMGRAFGIYAIPPNLGPLLAPILGGLLLTWRGWRTIAWFLALYGAVLLAMLIVLLPETSAAAKARRLKQGQSRAAGQHPSARDIQPRMSRLQDVLYSFTFRPLLSMRYILFPPVGLTAIYLGISFSATFAYSTNIPYEFTAPPYSFAPNYMSLMYLGGCFGQIIGSMTSGYLSDRVVTRLKKTQGDRYKPECRLKIAWAGVFFVPTGLLIYGWTAETEQYWLLPLIGTFLYGFGMQVATTPVLAYYSEAMPGKSASVVAVYNLCRMVPGAVISAVTPTAIRSIGTAWFMTALAILSTMAALGFEAIRRWGSKWRANWETKDAEEAREL